MPALPTSTVIDIAKVSEYLALQDINSRQFYNTQVVDKRLPYLLYLERKAVEFMYAYDSTDPYLDATTNYLLSLCGGYATRAQQIIGAAACIPTFFILQPVSQTTDSGNTATFTVIVGGTATITYQWYKNGVLMSGKTDATLSLTSVTSGDAADYTVIATNSCGSATSSTATLTVNTVSITGSYYYGSTDYFAALSANTDAISYQGTFSITHNSPISVPYPTAANTNMYLVIRVPVGESIKTTWYNTALNNGTIPDSAFRDALNPSGLSSYTYYVSRVQLSNDFTSPLILS